MVTACGLSAYHASIFHLSNHAFFKALLFLTAGSIIHAMSNEQDIKMGGVLNLLPYSYCMVLIGSLALMGFPFLSGYYSKDIILEIAYSKYNLSGHFAFWLGSLSAMFTSFYSIRLIFLTFLGEVNSTKNVIKHIHEAPFLMSFPMTILSIPSIFIGYLSKGFFVGLGNPFWGNALTYSSSEYALFTCSEFLPFSIKIIPILFSTIGTLSAVIYYQILFKSFNILTSTLFLKSIYNFLNKKWYIDKIYNEFLTQYFLSSGYTFSYKATDRGVLEVFGPQGVYNNLHVIVIIILNSFKGLPYTYIKSIVVTLSYAMFLIFSLTLNLPLEIMFLFIVLVLFMLEISTPE